MKNESPVRVLTGSALTRRNFILSGAMAGASAAAAAFLCRSANAQNAASGRFIGELRLNVGERDGKSLYILENDFGYLDPAGKVWHAKGGLETDGASIPRALWPIVGHPFEGLYVKAAIVHDYYCVKTNRYRDWKAVHRAFKDAMLTAGVGKKRAALMFYAVWRFGPRWKISELLPCTPTVTEFCSNSGADSYKVVSEDFDGTPTLEEVEVLKLVKGEIDSDRLSLEGIPEREATLPTLERVESVREVLANSADGWWLRNPYRTPFESPQ